MKNYVQSGKRMTYVNATGSDIASGAVVVVGKMIGIATGIILDTETGELAMSGVFTVPKVSAAVIAQGEDVIWDSSAGKFDDNAATPATGDVSGCCVAVEAVGAAVTEIDVKLNIGIGTVT